MARTLLCLTALPLAGALFGCQAGGFAEQYGKTFYLDGAGNWGSGGTALADGLRAAGYQGDVEEYVWTTSFNPLVDQLNVVAARVRSGALAKKIRRYRSRYPAAPVNIVALSAGTGVATWAVEQLDENCRIDNLVLLGSSLSHDYDVTQALSNMTGRIHVYHSVHDCVLESVRVIGTIDGKRGVDSIGAVGLTAPSGFENRVVNTAWSREWLKYGWTGAHSDCTNAAFVRYELAKYIVGPSPAMPREHLAASTVSFRTARAASMR